MGGKLLFELEQDDVCNIYSEWKGKGEFLISGFEGIPQNFVVNFMCAVGVVVAFSFARRMFWNYGRLAVIQRNLSQWKEEYNPDKDESGSASLKLVEDEKEYMYPNEEVPRVTTDRRYDDEDVRDTGLFSWIRITLTLSEDMIYAKCGPDAVIYLRYQRHLIFLSLVICVCSLAIILPIHIQGEQFRRGRRYDPSSFAQTTLANLPSDSPYVWVHATLSFVYFVMSIIVMRHFSRSLRPSTTEDESAHRTVMILGIQRRMCHTEKILAHIKEIYPNCIVKECTFAYDTSKLFNLEADKLKMIVTVKYLQELFEETGKKRKIHTQPWIVKALLWWLWCPKQVDALEYYSKEVRRYKELADYERARTLGRPLGICFVTFRTAFTAERMIHDYNFSRRFWDRMISSWGPFALDRTPQSRYTRKMRAEEWSVLRAPPIGDIQWENYGLSLTPWYLKAIMVNFTVLLLALFFSTPIILIKTINYYVSLRGSGKQSTVAKRKQSNNVSVGSLFFDLLPTLLIWVAAVTLPGLVTVSDRLIQFWARSAENRSRMIKTFSFLVVMVIILPSLGLSSILYMVGNPRLKWECIYSPSNAAFFLNYVTTSCFLGTTSELWRFPELLFMIFMHLLKKSSHENPAIRLDVLWEFQVGTQYAWMMLVFAVFSVFSLISPLITPLGVLYITLKHYVDKHNIFFAYSKCDVDNSVHTTAVNIVYFCMFLLLIITFVFTNVAWPDWRFNHNLQDYASELFILALLLFTCAMYVSIKGTLGTVIFRKKELKPAMLFDEIRHTKRHRLENLQKKASETAEALTDEYFYKIVPRIPIQPKNRYIAPMLRKDFPYVTPTHASLHLPINSHLTELLDYIEFSSQFKTFFDHLVHKISTMNVQRHPSEKTTSNAEPISRAGFESLDHSVYSGENIPRASHESARATTERVIGGGTWSDIFKWRKRK